MTASSHHVAVRVGEQICDIEYRWAGPDHATKTLVLLHEGLGSVAMWKGFEAHIASACGARVLVYSRPGYGRSTPRQPNEQWGTDFMHRQAREVLPAVLDGLGIWDPVGLIGHSDGASIALIAAAHLPDRYHRVAAMAPHTFVEDICIAAIQASRSKYTTGGLKQALSPYHDDPDSAYFGWSTAWLDPEFRSWNMLDLVAQLQQPILCIQGEDDEYGTMAQVLSIARAAPQTETLKLAKCGHAPHRDQPQQVLTALAHFFRDSAAN